jgi:hypothetical protein
VVRNKQLMDAASTGNFRAFFLCSDLTQRRPIPGHGERAERGAVTCLELPIWMK